jgi:hypothetical protein
MVKQARTPTSARQQYSAATVLEIIESLNAPEKAKLFGQLAYHPDNSYVADLLDKGLQLAKLAKAAVESSDRSFQGLAELAKLATQEVEGYTNAIEQRRRIPPERRTIPLNLARAAKLIGFTKYRGDKDGAEILSKSIRDGSIVAEKLNRQSYIFDLRDFPKKSWPMIAPDT